ncbi:MAG TPA: sulfatase-like hydrolase/transferase [Ornithinibacter sp.]|nr:sulfatase-like hydrolase/transferase [Ornithinibacter sp.]
MECALSRPNFLLFMPDQLRADAVGAFGGPVASTPAIDALAARGVRFTNAFAQHSVCSPSRVSMFTGWYPHVAGHRTLTHLLKPWEPNLFRTLRDAGYHVAAAGLRGDLFAPGVSAGSVDRMGFQVPPTSFRDPLVPEGHPLRRAMYAGSRGADVVVDIDEATTRTAEAWLAEGLPEPWLLFVPLVFPHPPFGAEEPWYSLHDRSRMPAPCPPKRGGEPRFMPALRDRLGTDALTDHWAELAATYHGMVSRVDHQLGRLLGAVERAGAGDRTVTAFFTDHGEYLGDFGLVEKWPAGVDDCLVRNPLVMAGPGVASGGACGAMVEMVDLLPTLCELAEAEVAHTHFGRSLADVLAEPGAPHRDPFSEGGFLVAEEHLLERAGGHYDYKGALQHEDPRLVGRVTALRTPRWTYVRRLYEADELYDRAADPQETTNLIGDPGHAAVVADLSGRLLDWLLETSDVVPWAPDPRFEPELVDLVLSAARPRS